MSLSSGSLHQVIAVAVGLMEILPLLRPLFPLRGEGRGWYRVVGYFNLLRMSRAMMTRWIWFVPS